MGLLVNLLDKYIFSGIPSNAAWDLVRAAWEKASQKSWEDLYLDAFEAAMCEARTCLTAYAEDGEVTLDRSALSKALHRDLGRAVDALPFSRLSSSEFVGELAKAMEERSVLVIGGHNLSRDDYAQLVRNLVRQANAGFKAAILADELALRRALLDEALTNQALVEDVQIYLADRFGLVLGKVDVIEGKMDIQTGLMRQVAADVKDIKQRPSELPRLVRVGDRKRTRTKVRVFVGSPVDVLDERNRLAGVIDQLNRGVADRLGLTLDLLRWETHVAPDAGRPQGVVSEQLPPEDWDVFVGVLWLRFGSETGEIGPDTGQPYRSGTEEEFKVAYRRRQESTTGWPKVMFYRCIRPPTDMLRFDTAQFARVQQFFAEFAPTGAHPGLVQPYGEPEEFERLVHDHLEKWLWEFAEVNGLLEAPGASRCLMPPPPERQRERKVLEEYLRALIREVDELQPGGIKQTKVRVVLPLEEIYIGLQANRDRPDVDRRVMQEELDEIKRRLEQVDDPKEREKQYEIWARDARLLEKALALPGAERVELSDIIQRHRKVVILGDPGAGKTTLLRYLALRFARAVLEDPDRLFEPQDWWDADNVWRLPDLGAVRLPILLRIPKYAEARDPRQGGDPNLSLLDYLPRYFAGQQVPHTDELGPILTRFLNEGRCVVLLDGLDEIIDYTDRRDIASNIARFAGTLGERGLPQWLTRFLYTRPLASPGRALVVSAAESEDEEDLDVESIPWDRRVPEEVRREWKERLKALRWGRRAWQMVHALLGEAKYSHVGNYFVVTSRIAGYHFAPLDSEFEHYTLSPMEFEDIRRFLEKWCPAVERRIADDPDPIKVKQRAQREIEGILKALEESPGVRRMAQNPLLLRTLAIIHRNEAHLPQRRVELYETATVTLLRDWNLERGVRGGIIDEIKAMSLLGPVALWIHENRASAHVEKGQMLRLMTEILARERGEDPQDPSMETRQAVNDFLEAVRQHSGLLVERGEGLYGFMHLTFEEYFTARQMVSKSNQARTEILKRLHQPRWREPILLAVGLLSKTFYQDTHALLRAILDAGSDYEPELHRDLLFAAVCVGDSVNVSHVLRKEIAHRLLSFYCDRHGAGRYLLLQRQIRETVPLLCHDQGQEAVEVALAEVMRCCHDQTALSTALEAVEWLNARTPALADALAACRDPVLLPRARRLLRDTRARAGNGRTPTGWDAYRDDSAVARLLGAMWWCGWDDALSTSLTLSETACDEVASELGPLRPLCLLEMGEELVQRLDDVRAQETSAEFWQTVRGAATDIYDAAPGGSRIEAAAIGFRDAIPEEMEEGEAIPPLSEGLEEALKEFRQAVRELREAVAGVESATALERAGQALLKGATNSHTLAPSFAAIAGRLAALEPWPGEEIMRARVQSIQADLARALLDALRTIGDSQLYHEAALLLVRTGRQRDLFAWPFESEDEDSEENRFREAAVGQVCADLEHDDAERRRWALQVLGERAFHKHVEFTDARRVLLMDLLGGPADQAALALDILFAVGPTSDLLAWCWTVLRQPDHSLADAVREHLDGVKELKGTTPVLALLDEGVGDEVLRPVALELLRKVTWQGAETFAKALAWLMGEDTEVHHLAALLLAEQDNLLAVPRAVLAEATQKMLKAIVPLAETNWGILREYPQVVRLLGGLWLHGWDDTLTHLWVAQPAKSYVDNKHPRKDWGDFRTYPESEEAIRWMLEQAEYGQTLIPFFRQAAARLAQLEGKAVRGEPKTGPGEAHIATVQQELIQQVDALIVQTETPLSLRLDGGSLAAAIRGETVEGPSAEELRQALASVDSGEVDAVEALAVVSQLLRLKQPRVALWPWLRSLVALDKTHPLAAWLLETLARHGLGPNAPPVALARLFLSEDSETQAVAALVLLAADLSALLVPALVKAALSQDDRIRLIGEVRLNAFCDNILATDGSTQVIDSLHRDQQAGEGKGAHEGTIMGGAVGSLRYSTTYWPTRYFDLLRNGDASEQKFAREALQNIGRPSPQVIELLSQHLADPEQPERVRYAAMRALTETRRRSTETRSDATIHTALTTALADPAADVRRGAAYALQWTEGRGTWDVAQALLHTARSDPDAETRILPLRSLGRVLHVVRGFQDVDVSKEALYRWLHQESPNWMDDFVDSIGDLPSLAPAPDAFVALHTLAQVESVELPEAIIARLRQSDEWTQLLERARQEWSIRRYWAETLPHLSAAIGEVEAFLTLPDPTVRRAAACALARLYYGDDDRPARLRTLLPDDITVLRAMLDDATDLDHWKDEGGLSPPSHHPAAVKQIAMWVEAQPREERERLIDVMLDDLEQAAGGMEKEGIKVCDVIGDEPWSPRRILMAVLAELSERFTYRAFIRSRDLAQVVSLFARVARDPGSYSARRFGIRALGNMQQFTTETADAFFEACQDVSDVYRETRIAVTKFKVFGAGSLEKLTAAVRSPSITVAYHAAMLLGELGINRSEELGQQGRKLVAGELVRILEKPLSERIAYDFTESADGKRVGPLYDVIYEGLVRVVAGPDAPV